MGITRLPRELGIILRCSGVEGRPNCKAKLQTAQIEARGIRAYAKTIDWGHGLRKGRKRCDLCPACMLIEQKLFKEAQAATEAWKNERNERRKAKWAEQQAAKPPKKPRKKKGSDVATSPQAACEEYLPTPEPSPSAA